MNKEHQLETAMDAKEFVELCEDIRATNDSVAKMVKASPPDYKAHAERLAEALKNLIGKIEEMHGCMEVNYAEGNEECYPEFDVAREALAAWEAQK